MLRTVKDQLPDGFKMYHSATGENAGMAPSVRFNYICGLLTNDQVIRFQRTIFRITRGKAFLDCYPLQGQSEEKEIQKTVFFIAVQLGGENTLLNKILEICEIFMAKTFTLPKSKVDISTREEELEGEISSNKKI